MWPAIYSLVIRAFQADALFVSALQRSDEPSVCQVRQAITAAVRGIRPSRLPERVAQEFGDHPETAVTRMRWARAVAREAFTDSASDSALCSNAGPLLVVRSHLPADQTSDSAGRAA